MRLSRRFDWLTVAAYALLVTLLWLAVQPLALAQTDAPPADPRTWFASPAALGAVIKFAVDLIRKYWPKLDGPLVYVAVAVLSAALTALGVVFHLISSDPFGFGFGAFTFALGLNLALKQIGGTANAQAKPAVADPATRARAGQ